MLLLRVDLGNVLMLAGWRDMVVEEGEGRRRMVSVSGLCFVLQTEDGIRELCLSRVLGVGYRV